MESHPSASESDGNGWYYDEENPEYQDAGDVGAENADDAGAEDNPDFTADDFTVGAPANANHADHANHELRAWEKEEIMKWGKLEEELALLEKSATAPIACEFLRRAIDKRKTGSNPEFIRGDTRSIRLVQKVFVDVDQAPDFNFVGKILGPKGANAKRVAMEANVKVAICGRGSTKDKSKEKELIGQGAEYEHLKEPLHVKIESTSPPSRAWANMQHAVELLQPLLTPDDDVSAGIPSPSPRGVDTGYYSRVPRPPLHRPVLAHPYPYRMMSATSIYPNALRPSGFGKIRGRARGRGGRGRPY